MIARAAVPIAEIVLVGVWMGAALLFVAVVAPAAFAVLPTPALAGALVGRVLPILLYGGVVMGTVILILEVIGRTGAWGRTAAGALATLACATAQWFVGSRIERLRMTIAGPLEALAGDDPRRIAFGKLHAVSVAWLGVAMLAALVALILAMRAIRRPP